MVPSPATTGSLIPMSSGLWSRNEFYLCPLHSTLWCTGWSGLVMCIVDVYRCTHSVDSVRELIRWVFLLFTRLICLCVQPPSLLPNHLRRPAHPSRTVTLTKTGTLLWSTRPLLPRLPVQANLCHTRISLPGECQPPFHLHTTSTAHHMHSTPFNRRESVEYGQWDLCGLYPGLSHFWFFGSV